MKILIVEDERPTAEDLAMLLHQVLGPAVTSIDIENSLANALHFFNHHSIDLLLLDLNLNGKDGFQLLRTAVANAFETIVVSANTDRALEAFEYGVLDFIAKPYTLERLQKALDRFKDNHAAVDKAIKFLSVRSHGAIELLPIKDVVFFKGANVYVEVHKVSSEIKLIPKTLDSLGRLLSERFYRIHKSYLVNLDQIQLIHVFPGGKYEAELKSGVRLPVSRTAYKELKSYG